MRHYTPRTIATTTILAIIIIALWAMGMSARNAHITQMGNHIDACGYVFEEGEPIPASCIDEDVLIERMDRIRDERSGSRTWVVAP